MPFDDFVQSGPPILEPIQGPPVTEGDISDWPWPRLIATQSKTLGLFKQADSHIYVFEMTLERTGLWSGYVVADIGHYETVGFVDVADFGPFYVITTPLRTFARNPLLTNDTVDRDIVGVSLMTELEAPRFVTCANYKQQFLGGNIHNYPEFGTNSVMWSAIGAFEFSIETQKTAGFLNLISNRADGSRCTIQRLLPLRDAVVCYTNHGILLLRNDLVENTFTYGRQPLATPGVASGNHVAGDEFTQGFIDLNHDFWILGAEGVQKRGYKKFIDELFEFGDSIIVSYLPVNKQFYISNSFYSLVINAYGAFTCHQAISSIVQGWDNNVYATFRDLGDTQARVTVDATDFGDRNLKTLESCAFGTTFNEGERMHISAAWKPSNSSHWIESTPVLANPSGFARLCISAPEYKIRCVISNYVDCDVTSVTANVKFPDARFRRGTLSAER